MSDGMRIVKSGSQFNTANPLDIVLDTNLQGSLKIISTVKLNLVPGSLVNTFTNGSGIVIGSMIYSHNLGYPPAFMAWHYSNGGGLTELMPTASALGGPLLQAHANKTNITIDGLSLNGLGVNQGDWIIIKVFAESLDA